jgi:hypothetical protein
MNSLRPLILITPCFIPRLLWTCLRISYPRSYHAIILKFKIKIHTYYKTIIHSSCPLALVTWLGISVKFSLGVLIFFLYS